MHFSNKRDHIKKLHAGPHKTHIQTLDPARTHPTSKATNDSSVTGSLFHRLEKEKTRHQLMVLQIYTKA
jgi:hypothetical protein